MAALPYMQLYVADYLADTAHLTAAQHGAYLLLLMNYWQRGKPLKNSNERLANVARMSNEEWNENKKVLEEFFTVTNEEWIHHRVDNDLEAVKGKSEKAQAAGRASANKRANARTNERSAPAEQTFNHTDTDTDTDTDTEVKAKTKPEKLELPDWLPSQDWVEYLKMRKNKKSPLTPYAEILRLRELVGLHDKGYDALDLLRQSIANCWLGFVMEKAKKRPVEWVPVSGQEFWSDVK